MKGASDLALKAGLSVALLLMGLFVSLSLPPSFLAGNLVSPGAANEVPLGRLAVTVSLRNETGVDQPLLGVSVSISQFAFFGLRAILKTNASGQVEMQLAPGIYDVSVRDTRFSVSTSAPVQPHGTTQVLVAVNRTALWAAFASAQDSTSSGQIETWNRLTLEVVPPGVCLVGIPWSPVGQTLVCSGLGWTAALVNGSAGDVASTPRFGDTVFIKAWGALGQGPWSPDGGEVPAAVISQNPTTDAIWLTVQPLQVIDISGSTNLQVVTYTAGITVTVSNG